MPNRLETEKAFHNEAFARGIRKPLDRYYSIFSSVRADFLLRLKELAKDTVVLECGCGINSYAGELQGIASDLTGIDISDEAVRQSEKLAMESGAKNCRFLIMDAENLKFDNNSLGLLFGVGIIHHLDLNAFFDEAARVLTPDGSMLFMEPLGHNPLLNIYRRLTPKYRTPDEHPLLIKDLGLINRFFSRTTIRYYFFFALLAVPFRNSIFFSGLLKLLNKADRLFFRWIPFARYLAWYCIIEAHGPKKE